MTPPPACTGPAGEARPSSGSGAARCAGSVAALLGADPYDGGTFVESLQKWAAT